MADRRSGSRLRAGRAAATAWSMATGADDMTVYPPDATWPAMKAALHGASIVHFWSMTEATIRHRPSRISGAFGCSRRGGALGTNRQSRRESDYPQSRKERSPFHQPITPHTARDNLSGWHD
ncbi:MAG: hypothetical protein MUQ27_03480 [Acidimicrobiia bacterium]|nr:hypothetical protein [Acidimicrobiia bacterium]